MFVRAKGKRLRIKRHKALLWI